MTKLILPLLGCVMLALGTGSSFASQAMQCGIIATSQNGMLSIQGAILSDTAIAGSYQFILNSSGPDGSSSISQGGTFAAAANSQTILGETSIDDGSKYEIEFSITSDGAELDCSKELPTR